MKYNIYINNGTHIFTIFETSESDLKRLLNAYDIGSDSIFINGKKFFLEGLEEIYIYDLSKLSGSLNDFINTTEAKEFHIFNGNRLEGLSIAGLNALGVDMTNDFINEDYGWKSKNNTTTSQGPVPGIPVAHLQNVLNLLTALDNQYGFTSTSFSPPEPSHLETARVGWKLGLKEFPNYYFYFRELGTEISFKHFPTKTENKEREYKLILRGGRSFEFVKNQALEWLKIIDDGRKEQKRWNEFFSTSKTDEYIPFEIIDEEDGSTTELTQKEIENVKIFLNAFDDLIQSSKTLPEETKIAYSQVKQEAESRIIKKPTRAFYEWLKKAFDTLSVKYLSDHAYRAEVNGYFAIAFEKIKLFGELAFEWIKQLGN